MNETAQEALNRLITMAVDGMEGAAAFAEAELPSVIEQLLTWKLLESLIIMIFPLILFLITLTGFARVVIKIMKAKKSKDNDGLSPYEPNFWWDRYSMSGMGCVSTIGLGAVTLVSAIATLALANLNWLYILVAPKVYLLEYATDLVK